MNIGDKRSPATISLVAVLLIIGMVGAVASPAAAVSVDSFENTPTPADVPTDSEDVDQNLTSTGPLNINTSAGINESIAVEYDLSGTPMADALTSDTSLSVSSNTGNSVAFSDVSPEDGIATFTIDAANASRSGNPANISVTATLEQLDTSSLSTETGLDYRITTSSDQTFTSDPIASDEIDRATFTPEFNLAFVEVNDLDNNDNVVVTSIGGAFNQSNIDTRGNNDVDLDNDIRIDVGGGDYTFDDVTVENSSMTLQPVEGDDVRFIHNGTSSPFFNVSTTGGEDISDVSFQDVTMDFDTQTNATGIAVNGGAGEVDDVTIDGVTFEDVVNDAQNGTTAVEINSTAGGNDGVSITGSTFDAAPDADDVVRPATAINVSGSTSDLKLTVENNNFDGFDESINVSVGIDESTIEGNSFNNGNTYVENGTQLNLDSINNNNDFGAFAIEQDSAGNIQDAIYGNLTQGIVDGTINVSADERVLIAGEHTGVNQDISVNGNSSTVTSPDGRDATIAGSGFNDVLINVTKFDGNPIDDVTVSDLTLQPNSNTDAIQLDGSNSSVDYQDITLTGSTFELRSSSIGINSTGNQDLIEAEISDNNFIRADSETNYTAAIDLGSFEVDDDGDVVSVDITDNEIDNADNGIEVVADDGGSDNLELDISNNAISLVEAGGDGINVTATDVKEVTIGGTNDGNTIIGSSDGTDATAINIIGSVDDKVEVTNNEIEDISTSSNNAGTAIDINRFNSDDIVTIENNELVDNAVQINASDTSRFNAGDGEIVDLINSQTTVQNDVRIFDDGDDTNRVDDLNTDVVFGAINATIAQANPTNNDVVSAGEGTYEETQIEVNVSTTIESAGSAENTVLTSDSGNRFINVSDGVTIDGFAFESTDDSDAGDIEIQDLSNGAVTIQNSIFVSPGTENRKGILVSSNDNDDNTVKIEDNEFTSYRAAVDVQQHGDSDLHIVRNTLSDNDRAIRIADGISHNGNGEAAINFNDIINNNVGLEVGDVSYNNINATASWWGDETGPSGDEGDVNEFVGEGDSIIDNYDSGGTNASIFLQESTTNLPDSGYVVVDDPSDVRANGNDEAFITVATLDDSEASDEAADSTNLLFPDTAGGVLSKNVQRGDGSVNASDPLVFNLTTEDAGEYLLRAQHDNGDVAQGEATQVFTGEISEVVVTPDSDSLVADGATTVNVTAQLSDGERDITLADQDINFLLDTTGIDNANVTREAQDDQTDALGTATLTLSTTQAGGEITVTAQDDTTGSSGEVTIQTVVEETANFNITNVDAPTTIVQNQSYTVDATISNDGDASGTQTVSYELLAEGGVTPEVEKSSDVTIDAGSSQTVSFELTAEETDALETGAFNHVLGTDDDEETVSVEVTDAQEANFQLELVDGPTQVTQNESYSATVDVTNNGGASGTQTVDYALEDDSTGDAAVTDSQDVTVDAGATEQVTFDVAASDTQSIAAGEYTHVISTDGADDATLGVTITVEDEQTVNVGGEDVPVEFTTTENGETTVTADNAVSAIDTFIAGDINADTAVSVIDAFIASQS